MAKSTVMPGALAQHLEKLRAFSAVGKAGSFHRASAELRMSQPAVSRSVKGLETALGVELFNRTRVGVQLTPEGKILLDFCDHLLIKLHDTERKLMAPELATAGVVQVGTYESLAAYFWPCFLKSFSRSHPGIQVRIVSGNEEMHRHQLMRGAMEMIVDAEPLPDERVESLVLYRDLFRFYGVSRYRSEMNQEATFIYVPQAKDRTHTSLREHLVRGGIGSERLMYELDTFSSAKEMTKAGLGIAVLPERLAAPDVARDLLTPIQVDGFPFSGFGEHRICVSFLKENKSDRRIQAVLSELRKARSMPTSRSR